MALTQILPTPDYPINPAGQQAGSVYGPGYAGVKLSSGEPIQTFRSNSKRFTTNAGDHHTWRISISYNPLECVEFHRIYTFVLDKVATLTPFYVSIPPYNNQTLTGITMDVTTPIDSSVFVVNGTGVSVGDVFTINDKAYQVVRVETELQYATSPPPSAGHERIHIVPPLKEEVNINMPLDFASPLFKVFPAEGTLAYSLDTKGLFNFGLELEEVFK